MEHRVTALIDRHRHRVYQLARMLLGEPAEAEDVAQDVLVKLWNHRRSVRVGEELGWLMACTRNACLDRLRKRTRSRRLLHLVTTPEAGNGPDVDAHQHHRARLLRRAVADLPEPGRSLVILRDMQGLDVATTAKALELSPTQVKVYTFRARRALRQALEEKLDEQAA